MSSTTRHRERPRVVVAPDKFHTTARGADLAAAVASALRAHDIDADLASMADGGEGTLDTLASLGGELRQLRVTGPLGDPVLADWLYVPAAPLDNNGARGLAGGLATLGLAPDGPVAVVEAARAVGRVLHPRPTGDDPLRAATTGVGELIATAVSAGARTVVVGLGGTAATDGGWGAIAAIGSAVDLHGAQVVVASDVTTRFVDAAPVFGPQKGATPEQIDFLVGRLTQLVDRFRTTFGVDVAELPGAGAAGGLAGGLAALGATIVPGVDLVAAALGLHQRIGHADLVITGEGRLDATSFAGKVVDGVLRAAAGRVPVWAVVGEVDPAMAPDLLPEALQGHVVSLVELYGRERAMTDTAMAAAEAVIARVVPALQP